jgi:hypothetical protein
MMFRNRDEQWRGYKLIARWEGKAGLIEAKHTTYLRTCVLENV